MTWFQLLNAKWPDLIVRYPFLRRYFELGFELDATHHADNRLAIRSRNQDLMVDLETGELVA